jgi:hypothetical protein
MGYIIRMGTLEQFDADRQSNDWLSIATNWTMPMETYIEKIKQNVPWVISALVNESRHCECGDPHFYDIDLETAQNVVGGSVETAPIPNFAAKQIWINNTVNSGLIKINQDMLDKDPRKIGEIKSSEEGSDFRTAFPALYKDHLHNYISIALRQFKDLRPYLLVNGEPRSKQVATQINWIASTIMEREIYGDAILCETGNWHHGLTNHGGGK